MPFTSEGPLRIPRATVTDMTDPRRHLAALNDDLRIARADNARLTAELDRLDKAICSALLHDGERYGRVANPTLIRALFGLPQHWEAK